MYRRVLYGSSLAIGALALASGAGAGSSPSAGNRASLRLMDTQPVVIGGSSFRARERVRITTQLDGKLLVRFALASRTGVFRLSLGENTVLDRCNSPFSARAVGSRGSTALLKMPELLCPPSLTPSG